MQNIVLITHDNGERVTGVSVFLCNRYEEVGFFCKFVNTLSLADGENIFARRVKMGECYTLEKRKPFAFDDIVTIGDRMLQKILRKVDAQLLVIALAGSGEQVQHKFFINMSMRAAIMIKEDMEYMGYVDESMVDVAKQEILDVCFSVMAVAEEEENYVFKQTVERYTAENPEGKELSLPDDTRRNYDEENIHIVLVYNGTGKTADTVSVMLFNSPRSADNFCDYINGLKTAPGSFVYARRAEQMVEYETARPLPACFVHILDYPDDVVGKALARVSVATIVCAVKGLDGYLREKILGNLPEHMEERVLKEIKMRKTHSKKYHFAICGMGDTRSARRKIVDAVIKANRKKEKECVVEVSVNY